MSIYHYINKLNMYVCLHTYMMYIVCMYHIHAYNYTFILHIGYLCISIYINLGDCNLRLSRLC